MGLDVIAMKESKAFYFEYADYDFHREDKPLIPKDATKEETMEIRNMLLDMKREIENNRIIEMPEGSRLDFRLIPNSEGTHYSARLEIRVSGKRMQDFRELIKDWMEKAGESTDYPYTPRIENFIRSFMEVQRDRLKRELERLRMEINNNRMIDVKVLGGSGVHRVSGRGENLECECPQFKRTGECHHVELVKTLRREGLLKDRNGEVEPPVVVIRSGKGETEFDTNKYRITIYREDENKTKTIRTLYAFGYGLEAMKAMGIVPRKMRWEQLKEILDGKDYEEVMNREMQISKRMGEVEMEA